MGSDIAVVDSVIPRMELDKKIERQSSDETLYSPMHTTHRKESPDNVNEASAELLNKLQLWNPLPAKAVESSIHELIRQRCQSEPEKCAVNAWNGEFSYRELDTLSSSLEAHLVDLGVGPETFVPVYFEKSRWTLVAILGILKAGGAFVLLDPAHPTKRLRGICQTLNAKVLVASPQYATTAHQLVESVVVIDETTSEWRRPVRSTFSQVGPHNAAYAIFTSGTSGTPKGVVLEHRSFCTGSATHAAAFNINSSSRVLQFASYAFDACLIEMLTPLIMGGCVCIPSEAERKRDLGTAARRFGATWALFTPSMARVLEVDDFSSLKTLVLGGEAMVREDIEKWAPHFELFNAYGPAECTPVSVVSRCSADDPAPASIGYNAGSTGWIVDKDDHDKLVPIGDIGELLIDGPTVGRGYVGNAQKTAEVFIDPPKFLSHIRPGSTDRVYKTGDLAKYSEDGSIQYVGRKDTQAKLHGQRMELGEVEYHLRQSFPDVADLAAEIVKPMGNANSPLLAAFLVPEIQPQFNGGPDADPKNWLMAPSEEFRLRVQSVTAKLENVIPKYMVPTAFLTLSSMPLSASSGKIDRRRLCEIASACSRRELQRYCDNEVAKQQPSTSAERTIQELWARVLQIRPEEIGLKDNFLTLGGNSIRAMQLAGAARRDGLTLEVGDIWSYQNLEEMAAVVQSRDKYVAKDIRPFSLLQDEGHQNELVQLAMRLCQVERDDIEDIYPCTSLQEGLMSLTAKRSHAYTIVYQYELPLDTDIDRFQAAWRSTIRANPILRTRMVQAGNGEIYQAVIRDEIPFDFLDRGEPVPREWQDWKFGRRLLRLAISPQTSATEKSYFTLIIHHAIVDGWSLKLDLKQVEAAYNHESLPHRPFSPFIEYTARRTSDDVNGFWRDQFVGLEAGVFPRLPSPEYSPVPAARAVCTIPRTSDARVDGITVPTKLKLAWAVINSLYTDNNDVVFGNTVTGRGAPVVGLEEMTGPAIASIPVRYVLDPEETVADTLRKVNNHSIATIPFDQAGIQNISRLSSECAAACQYQSLLVIQPEPDATSLFSKVTDMCDLNSFSTTIIMLQCKLSCDSIELDATFDPKVVDPTQMRRILNQLKHIFQQIERFPSIHLRDLEAVSAEDFSEILTWNGSVHNRLHVCAHDVITNRCLAQPEAPAVCAWDGNFMYHDLELHSSMLAKHLAHHGVGPGIFVPLYFEKSRWTTVAMLGVMKAGGAFVLLDPSHPLSRLQGICHELSASLIVTSEANLSEAVQLIPKAVVLGDQAKEWTQFPQSTMINSAKSNDPIYAVFTSGSTGTPKGAVMSHSSWYTSADANRAALYLDTQSRVLQFASYAFDISIADNLLTLLAGGCVCVPSDQERVSDLVKAIDKFQVNWACLTPSVARVLNPDNVPTIQRLLLTGEAMTAGDVNMWSSRVHLLNVYGPAECAILTSTNRHVVHPDHLNNIGRPTSAVCWIVNPWDHAKLTPVGAIGELVVESPIVSGGYLNEADKTAAVFIESPPWLQQLRAPTSARFYKTGDLVRYMSDGSMQYIGRKDTQIKLHGQRIELGEVEYYAQRHFPDATDTVAAVVPLKGYQSATLVTFVLQAHNGAAKYESGEALFRDPDSRFLDDASTALSQLADVLPRYMIPAVFIPLSRLPLSPSGKLDRRALREQVMALSSEQVKLYNVEKASTKQTPVTDTQRQLQQLFAKVLQIPSAEISVDGHFFRLGGDSVMAMKLVALSQEAGCAFTVADVFNHPRLVDLARKINPNVEALDLNLSPFTLMKDSIILELVILELLSHGQLVRDQIEDIYPCTPLQEGMMALSAKNPESYVSGADGYLKPEVDIRRFRDAVDATVVANPILRTRITQTVHGSFQVVIRDKIPWELYESQEDYAARSIAPHMGPNERLLYLALIAPGDDKGSYRFVLTIHHALYDGWSLSHIWNQIEAAYNGSVLEPRPFNGFIDYILRTEQMEDFWRSQFTDMNAAIFPALPSSNYSPMPTAALTHFIADFPKTATDHTMSTAIRLAWSVVLSHYTDSNDVVFGSTISGRSAPVAGIDQVSGPTIGTVPFRVRLMPEHSIEDALSAIQSQVAAMIPYEHGGLQNIRKLSKEAAAACDFQSQLGIQPWVNVADNSLFTPLSAGEQGYGYGAFASYAFVIVCHLGNRDRTNNIKVAVSYDSHVVDPARAQRIVDQFEHILRYVIEHPEEPLRSVPTVNPQDMQQLLKWNGSLPDSYDKCLHHLVLDHSHSRPNDPAISAWDGDLTYSELESASSTLTKQLRALGIGKGSLAPVCFEKSKWCIITIMAVLRSGAACVCIDHKHPADRIRQILKQTKPHTILTSPTQRDLFTDDGSAVVTIPLSDKNSEDIGSIDTPDVPVSPQDPAFIIFTSGSTGQPKGIVMEHANLSTSIRDHSDSMNVCKDTRALHFAGYAFDASIYEIFTTLLCGACICIPSEEDRMNNLVGFIHEREVNWALFTPSLINGLIQPDQIPGVHTIVVAGEALSQETVDTWASRVTLINGYGPAEASICAAAGLVPADGWVTGTIGPITGGVGWITLPSDPSRLAPVGAVGELIIEGPVVTRGYLNDTEKTAAAYFTHFPWLTEFRPQGKSRLYRSGDLVQYTSNGSIRFVGRKDSQVKLRGQRIELSEVEYHVKQCFPDAAEVVAEVIVPAEDHGSPTLIAFVVIIDAENEANATSDDGDLFVSPNRNFLTHSHGATIKLRTKVPSYLVPSAFVQLSRVPRTRSDKVNRLLLRQQAATLPLEQRREFSTLKSSKREPATEKEKIIRDLWAEVLKTSPDRIGTDDEFFQLGGDSIMAMKVVSLALQRRLRLAVRSIFDNPVLSDLAQTAKELSAPDMAHEYRPGSLLDATTDLKAFVESISGPHQSFKTEDVEDVLPATELQSQLLEAENITYIRLSVPLRIDADRLEAACHAMVRQHAILRTIFMDYRGKFIQVVLRDLEYEKIRMGCDPNKDLEGFADSLCAEDSSSPVPLGVPYLKAWLLSRSETEHMLILRTTHAQYDGASFPLLLRDLAASYNGKAFYPAGPPFYKFLKFREEQRTPESYQFWREYLESAHVTDLKGLSAPQLADSTDEFVIKPMKQIPLVLPPEGVTMATLVKAAWAMVLAELTDQKDVMFGHVITGRDAPIAGVERMAAPLITICPIRVTIQPSWTVMDLLNHVQSQYTRAMPYAHVEFDHIRENSTSWPAETELSSVVTHQNGDQVPTFELEGVDCPWKPWDIGIPPHFHVISFPVDNSLVVQLTASSKKFRPEVLEHMLDRLCKNISTFSEENLRPLAI